MSGRKRSPRPSGICRPGKLTPAPPSQRRRPCRQSSRRRSQSWSSPTWPATLRLKSRAQRRAEVHRAAAAAEASGSRGARVRRARPCLQRVRRISSSLRRPTKAAALLSRCRTRRSARRSRADRCRRLLPSGVDRAPTGALALADGLSAPKYDDDALLARAAELTAPLPPMPIANVGVASTSRRTLSDDATADTSAVQPQQHGWVARTAALAAEDIAQLFGVFKTSSPAHASPDDLRASQQ